MSKGCLFYVFYVKFSPNGKIGANGYGYPISKACCEALHTHRPITSASSGSLDYYSLHRKLGVPQRDGDTVPRGFAWPSVARCQLTLSNDEHHGLNSVHLPSFELDLYLVCVWAPFPL